MKFLRKNSKKSWPIDNVWKNLSGCTDFQISYFFQIFSNFCQKNDTLRHTNALYQWKYILEVGISKKMDEKPKKHKILAFGLRPLENGEKLWHNYNSPPAYMKDDLLVFIIFLGSLMYEWLRKIAILPFVRTVRPLGLL